MNLGWIFYKKGIKPEIINWSNGALLIKKITKSIIYRKFNKPISARDERYDPRLFERSIGIPGANSLPFLWDLKLKSSN